MKSSSLDLFAAPVPEQPAPPTFRAVHQVKEARRDRKKRQAFFTPLALVAEIVQRIDLWTGALVLEPSAGDGRFVHALRTAGAIVHACEIDDAMRAKCAAEGAEILGADFLALPPNPIYPFVVMNPPFSGRQYRTHIEHAYRFLRPGGMLWAIAPANAEQELVLGEWNLQGCEAAHFERIAANAFKEEGTSCATILATIHGRMETRIPYCGSSNRATGETCISCASDRATYEAVRRGTVDECKEICLRYLAQHGGTAYGVDWAEVYDYIAGDEGGGA